MATNQILDNRYQIIKKLQDTHVSITFQGKDTRRFNRLCLIKQLKTSYDPQLQQELEKRFQQEAEILERLGRHPQIPDLYDCFSENNQLYLVQEWIAGCNLQQKFQQEVKLIETELKDILIKLLPVLEFLQENQIIHRDIKPNNIMLNGENLPILIDFGIVKEIYTMVNPNIAYTVMGIGTPGFVSAEQKKGQPTHASDIYSLGVTAIYLLTGKVPSGKLSWRQDIPNISPEFADILDKSIEENLSDRYQTATEMLAAVENIKTSPLNPKDAETYYKRGIICGEQGEYEQVSADYSQAIQLNTEYAEAYNNRGVIYGEQGEYEQAIAGFNQAILLNPEDTGAYNNRGNVYYKVGVRFTQEIRLKSEDAM